MEEAGAWKFRAPADAYILGLKELDDDDESALKHTHIYFGHCFKYQTGWKELLKRFVNGGGCLLDMEFLTNDQGIRHRIHWKGAVWLRLVIMRDLRDVRLVCGCGATKY